MTKTTQIKPPLDVIPSNIYSAQDYEYFSGHFIAPATLAYIAGGSGEDVTLNSNRNAFAALAIYPRLFSDLSSASTQTSILKQVFEHPILLSPVAHQGLVHNSAELGTARGAAATNTCMIASTLSSVTLEQIATQSRQYWFQLYFQSSEARSALLVQRAIDAGYQSIVVTVDGAIQAPSARALRANFHFPSTLKAANLSDEDASNTDESVDIFSTFANHSHQVDQLKNLINHSPIPVIVKGVMHPQDAKALQELGAAAIIVSNHGGRTVDGAPASLGVLTQIRAAVGEQYPLLFDGGIRSGTDIFKAIALGADAVLIGRLQVYALAVAGALGVGHMIKLLRQELELCMAQAGCASITDIQACVLHHIRGDHRC